MKRFIKILFKSLFILIGILLILVIVLPIIFKPQLMNIAKKEINKNVEATVDFGDLKINLIRNFPRLYVGLTDLSVVGLNEFEGDTLVAFKTFSVSVDLLSVIGNEGIKVKSILLDEPKLLAKVLENGKANWDIAMETEQAKEEVQDTSAGEPAQYRVQLKKFRIRDANITYNDRSSDLFASVDELNFTLSGDMTQDYTDLNIQSGIEGINLVMGGIRYLKNAVLNLDIAAAADLKNMNFTFEENEISLNDLTLGFDGEVSMPAEDIDVDVTFFTKQTRFKTLLSMVPAIYMTDFEDLETDGELALNGYAKGRYSSSDSTLPSIGLELTVKDAMFKYPDLPKSVEDVNIQTKLFVDGEDMDRTTVDLNTFHLTISDNPVDAEMHIRTPISDPEVNGMIKGNFDLASFLDIIPLEDVNLKGIVDANLELGGRMSMYENQRYEDFKADGKLALNDFEYSSPDLPADVIINEILLEFSPRYVELGNLDCKIGQSDFQLNGRLENFIPYIFSDGTVTGNLEFNSSLLDLNEFIPEDEGEIAEEVAVDKDTTAVSVIEVPGNIDFSLTSSLKQILFDKIEISNTEGIIRVNDSRVIIEGLNMDILEGSMGMSGEYNTQDMTRPAALFDLDVTKIDIQGAFNTFNTVQKLAPFAENLNGKISVELKYESLVGSDMLPVVSSIDGYGKIRSESVQVISSKTFDMISDALKLSSARSNTFKDLNISFNIRDGRIYVDPFRTELEDIEMIIGGDQGIDQTMNYLVKMIIPRAKFGTEANQVIDNLAAQAQERGLNIKPGEKVNIDVTVTGTFSDPKISLDMKEAAGNTINQVKEQLEEKVREVIEKKKEEVIEIVEEEKEEIRAKADEEAQKIIKEAEGKAEEVRALAKKAADTVIKEADTNAKKLEDEAKGKGRLAELAAKRAADKIRSEAKEKADRLVKEADDRSEQILEEARQKAELIKKEDP